MPRRLRVDRSPPRMDGMSKEMQMEIMRLIDNRVEELSAKLDVLNDDMLAAKIYIHNVSTILRDINNAVLLAKFEFGSTKTVLEELIQGLEVSLQNAQHLPPPHAATSPEDWVNTFAATPETDDDMLLINRTVEPTPEWAESDPVEDVGSEM